MMDMKAFLGASEHESNLHESNLGENDVLFLPATIYVDFHNINLKHFMYAKYAICRIRY